MTQNFDGERFTYQSENLRTADEKRFIRRAGNAIGIAGIIVAAVSQLWYYAAVRIARLFGIAEESVRATVTNAGFSQFVQVLFSVFCFFVPFLIAAGIMRLKISAAVPFGKIKKGTFLPYLIAGVSFCAFANLALGYASSIFEALGFDYNVPADELPKGVIGFLIFTIASAVVPAMVEEFGCRGILIGILKPMGEGFAIVISAAVFGLLHGNFIQIPFAFLIGLILGFIRIKTGSLLLCILIHFINNFISVLLNYLGETVNSTVINVCYLIYLALCLALSFAAIRIIDKKDGLKLNKAETETGEKQKIKWFASSPAVIIFIVLEMINSIRFFFI